LKSQEKTGNKGKERAQAAKDEVYSNNEGDAGDGDHQVNGDGARELVSEGEARTVIHSFIPQFEVTDSIVGIEASGSSTSKMMSVTAVGQSS
jgi:hypothetical protein